MINLREAVESIVADYARRHRVIWNGATWETDLQRAFRRIGALESHIRNLEDRYSYLEDRLNVHSNGVNHKKPKSKLPIPDVE